MIKKFLNLFVIVALGACMLSSCKDSNEPDPTPGPVVEEPNSNYWTFDGGEEVDMGSALIYESGGQVTALFSAKEGLVSAPEFDNVDDATEITFPASAIGQEIDLTKISDEDGAIVILSRLPEFGEKYGFAIDAANKSISEGKLSSKLEDGKMLLVCEFTTLNGLECAINMRCPFERVEEERPAGSHFDFSVASLNIMASGDFRTAFYNKNNWNSGWSFTYCTSRTVTYTQLNNYIEISVGSDELLNGEPFDIATTELPFSIRFKYLHVESRNTFLYDINNENRAGVGGTVTFKRNSSGLYDAEFDLSLNDGDISISGYYAGAMQPRNVIYDQEVGDVSLVRSATLDLTSNPVVMYLSSKNGKAGPEQHDVKCEVAKSGWNFNKTMAFSVSTSSITWLNGITYDISTSDTSRFFGGNWGVFSPVETEDMTVAECKVMLFGEKSAFAYYYGIVNVIR